MATSSGGRGPAESPAAGDDVSDRDLLLSLAAEAARSPPPPAVAPDGVAASPPSPPAPPAPPQRHSTDPSAAPTPSSSYTEPLSGLRITHAAAPRGALATAVAAAAARFGKLPLAVAMLRGGGEAAPVATAGVVVAADAARRVDRAGAPYLVLSLSDLDGTPARLCVRGRALDAAARVGVGWVVGVVGPRVAPPPARAPTSKTSRRPPPALLIVDAASSLLLLGRSRDAGRCAAPVGAPGSGARCGAPVNTARGPVCGRHAAREAARLRPGQGALADCGLAAHVARGLKRGRSGGGRPAPASCDPVAALPAPAAISAATASTGGRDTHGVRFVEATVKAGADKKGWVKAPAVGRLGARLPGQGDDDDDDAFVELAGSDDDGDVAAAPARPVRAAAPAPPLRPRPPPQPRTFDPNRVERSSSAQRAALAALKRGKAGGGAGGSAAGPDTSATPSPFQAAFAAVAAAAGPSRPTSRYGAAAADAAPGGLDERLAALQAKDDKQQRAASLFRLTVRCVTCGTCGYTAEAPHPACRAGGHALAWGTATKRWFACASCGRRAATLAARHPAAACAKCGGTEYRRVAAARDRADSEVEGLAERARMLARGEEVPRSVRDW